MVAWSASFTVSVCLSPNATVLFMLVKMTNGVLTTVTDTFLADTCDTIIFNIHTCYENYFPAYDSVIDAEQAYERLRTVWCLAAWGDATHADSLEWIFAYSLSYDSLHWVYIAREETLNLQDDTLTIYPVPKDADLFEWFRIIRTGGGDNCPIEGSWGEILLIWQLRGPKISGTTVGLQD